LAPPASVLDAMKRTLMLTGDVNLPPLTVVIQGGWPASRRSGDRAPSRLQCAPYAVALRLVGGVLPGRGQGGQPVPGGRSGNSHPLPRPGDPGGRWDSREDPLLRGSRRTQPRGVAAGGGAA